MALDLFGFRLIDAAGAASGATAKVAASGDGEGIPGLSATTAKVEAVPGGEPVSGVSAKVLGEGGEPSPAAHTAWISG